MHLFTLCPAPLPGFGRFLCQVNSSQLKPAAGERLPHTQKHTPLCMTATPTGTVLRDNSSLVFSLRLGQTTATASHKLTSAIQWKMYCGKAKRRAARYAGVCSKVLPGGRSNIRIMIICRTIISARSVFIQRAVGQYSSVKKNAGFMTKCFCGVKH